MAKNVISTIKVICFEIRKAICVTNTEETATKSLHAGGSGLILNVVSGQNLSAGWGAMLCRAQRGSFVGYQLLQRFSVSLAVEYSSCFISVLNLDLYLCCFDALMS